VLLMSREEVLLQIIKKLIRGWVLVVHQSMMKARMIMMKI
jgi:hypothetical protein